MILHQYVTNLNKLYQTGRAREHSFWNDLQVLLSDMLPSILMTNEPLRSECGASDFMLSRKEELSALHYQKIIVVLKETDGIMARIDGVLIL